jgi:hypothetical protein
MFVLKYYKQETPTVLSNSQTDDETKLVPKERPVCNKEKTKTEMEAPLERPDHRKNNNISHLQRLISES